MKTCIFQPFYSFNVADIDKAEKDLIKMSKAHEHGIICNVFYADDPEEAKCYRKMGIDCILTNDYLTIRNALTFENEN